MESENPGDSKSPGILILWERDDGGFAIYIYTYIFAKLHDTESKNTVAARYNSLRPLISIQTLDKGSECCLHPVYPSMKTYVENVV